MKQLTVFTPTYNRAYILPKLYKSLTAQTVKDFVWLIVDDGSTDDTKELVSSWIDENLIEIRYYTQQNGGKMKAHNLGVEKTDTELFTCIDSDDHLVNCAVEKLLNCWNNTVKPIDVCGIIAYRGSEDNKIISSEFPKNLEFTHFSDLYSNGFKGDTTLLFKTEILKKHPFPIIANEKFITEAFVYEQIDRQFRVIILPEIITVCEYIEDGLTRNLHKVTFNNPCGYVAYFLQKGNFAKSLIATAKAYVRANAFRKFTKGVDMPVKAQKKFLYFITRPFGAILYLKKKKAYDKH